MRPHNETQLLGIWIHVEGYHTPQYNSDGYVTAPDSTGTLITELSSFLDYAAEHNVFVRIWFLFLHMYRGLNSNNLLHVGRTCAVERSSNDESGLH